MDESVVAVRNDEDKVEEDAALKPVLEVSVSFGRFENDLLSWEKWSTFSPNKYLEEVEKYATPGSVAQKRAYFEAHYKKIADRKTKLLEEERQMEGDTTVSYELNGGDLMRNNGQVDSESDTSNYQVSAEEVEQTTTFIGEDNNIYRNVVEDDVERTIECESSLGGVKEELDSIGSEENKQEAVLVEGVETPPIEIQSTEEPPQKLVTNIPTVSKIKEEVVKSHRPKESKKATPVKKEQNNASVKKEQNIASVRKKPVSSTAKAPQIYTPKLSKTTPASIRKTPASIRKTPAPVKTTPAPVKTTPASITPAPRSSINKGSNSSLLRSRNQSAGEGKKVAPKSLHMSLSLGTPNSDPSSVTELRRSFIMEKMGDKDIVKRAFKTFKNSFTQMKSSPEEARSKQVPAKGKEARISPSMATRIENGGLCKSSGAISGADTRITRVAPSQKLEGKTFARAAGRMTLQSKSKVAPSQKLEEKFNAREGGKTNLQTKSKEVSKNGLRH